MDEETEKERPLNGGVFINKAIEFAKKAVDEDTKKNYEEALKLYQNSVEYFLSSIKNEASSKKSKDLIRAKCTLYLDRAEQLKTFLDKRNKDGDSRRTNSDSVGAEKHFDITKLEEMFSGAIVLDKPNVKFEDVAGLEEAKETLKEAVLLPILFPQLFTGRVPWRRILLYGPPGAGKSLLAKAVATEAKQATFFSVSAPCLVSKSFGDGENTLKALFQMAGENKPSIIFIDEVDALCVTTYRSENEFEGARRIRTECLTLLYGNLPGTIIGATNIPWALDNSVRRSFEKLIHIPLPGASARSVMFKQQIGATRNLLTEEDYTNLVQCSDGYSGADISNVVHDALMKPVRKVQTATHFRKVQGPSRSDPTVVEDDLLTPCSPGDPGATEMSWTDVPGNKLLEPVCSYADVLSSLKTLKATVNEDSLKKFADFTKDYVG